jgi:hypothetical protein
MVLVYQEVMEPRFQPLEHIPDEFSAVEEQEVVVSHLLDQPAEQEAAEQAAMDQ